MLPRHYFPLGKAHGAAFCNREVETKKLVSHIESGKHSFLVAPRRYGKSSLCERAMAMTDLAWAELDFYIATSEKDVERIVLNGVSALIGRAIGRIDQLKNVIKQQVKKLKPKFVFGGDDFHLEFEISSEASPAENIVEALSLLDRLLIERKKQAILLLDEFQEVGEIAKGRGVEGAIRAAAQTTKNLAIIFCGSNPHLLKTMFEDERRPLYKLCRKLVLDRISLEHYRAHLNKASHSMWEEFLAEDVFQKIMAYSERHPYYVNYICDEIWSECTIAPTLADVDAAWVMVIEEEKSDLLKDFFSLSENQRKIMIAIANYGGENIYSDQTSILMSIPQSSIARALLVLIERDYVEKVESSYRLIVPVYKSLLKRVGKGT